MSKESSEEVEQKKRSRAIDAALDEDARRLQKECKILLLGSYSTCRVVDNSRLISAQRIR